MKNLKYIVLTGVLVTLQSCFVAKNYERPDQVVNENLYRTDALPQDSISMADDSWKEIFTDQNLSQYIEKGLSNNLDIRMALQNIEAAQAYVKMGKAGFFPTLNADASYMRSTQSMNSQMGASSGERQFFSQYELSGTLSWEADIWGKIRSNKRAFVANYLQSVAAHQAVKSELVAAIASTYYQLLAFDEQKRITEETIANREQSLETIVA